MDVVLAERLGGVKIVPNENSSRIPRVSKFGVGD